MNEWLQPPDFSDPWFFVGIAAGAFIYQAAAWAWRRWRRRRSEEAGGQT